MDLLTIMAISGHKSMSVFRRYNAIDEADLQATAQRISGGTKSDTEAAPEEEKNQRQTQHANKTIKRF